MTTTEMPMTVREAAAAEWLRVQVDERGDVGYQGFYADLLRKRRRYGRLSERQVEVIEQKIARRVEYEQRRAEEAEALADVEPLREGRREVTGEVVTVKLKFTAYGEAFKMLVREADGCKVWGTVPGTLIEESYARARDAGNVEMDDENAARWYLVGKTVTLVATVERSENDEHFGFYSRPRDVRVVSGEAAK